MKSILKVEIREEIVENAIDQALRELRDYERFFPEVLAMGRIPDGLTEDEMSEVRERLRLARYKVNGNFITK